MNLEKFQKKELQKIIRISMNSESHREFNKLILAFEEAMKRLEWQTIYYEINQRRWQNAHSIDWEFSHEQKFKFYGAEKS